MPLYAAIATRELRQLLSEATAAAGAAPLLLCNSAREAAEFIRLHPRSDTTWNGGIILEYVTLSDLELIVEVAQTSERVVPIYVVFRLSHIPNAAGAPQDIHFFQFPENLQAAAFLVRSLLLSIKQSSDLSAARALSRELRYGRSPSFNSPLSSADILLFLDREWKRCFRYDWPISVIVARAGAERLPTDLQGALAECIRRPGDAAGEWASDGTHVYASILSETDSAGASHVLERMRAAFAQWRLDRAEMASTVVDFAAATLRPLELYRSRSPLNPGSDAADALIRTAMAMLPAMPAVRAV